MDLSWLLNVYVLLNFVETGVKNKSNFHKKGRSRSLFLFFMKLTRK